MTAGTFKLLDINQVELDRENPRIRRFLEIYEGEPTYETIALALDVASGDEDSQGATTPAKLRNSILTSGGIMQPIIVNKRADGRYICVEGNTRLYIYRAFVAEGVEGNWDKIPALVHDDLSSLGVDSIRLQAHLVGPRPWDAYSKAKYLWELAHNEKMPLDSLVALCGGNRRDVSLSIQAYADMQQYFRPLFEDGEDYDTERFSGFVEVQSNKVRTAILKAGLTLSDFASWIKIGKNGKIKGLIKVRQLPRVLGDKKARAVFLQKDIDAALDVLEKPELSAGLMDASISQLARALSEKIGTIQLDELWRLRANPDDDAVRYILDAHDALTGFIADLNVER